MVDKIRYIQRKLAPYLDDIDMYVSARYIYDNFGLRKRTLADVLILAGKYIAVIKNEAETRQKINFHDFLAYFVANPDHFTNKVRPRLFHYFEEEIGINVTEFTESLPETERTDSSSSQILSNSLMKALEDSKFSHDLIKNSQEAMPVIDAIIKMSKADLDRTSTLQHAAMLVDLGEAEHYMSVLMSETVRIIRKIPELNRKIAQEEDLPVKDVTTVLKYVNNHVSDELKELRGTIARHTTKTRQAIINSPQFKKATSNRKRAKKVTQL